MRFVLQPYKGQDSRHTCPVCKKTKVFSRYTDTQNEIIFPYDIGRCNREIQCGYHKTPRDYFREHPTTFNSSIDCTPHRHHNISPTKKTPTLIAHKYLNISLRGLKYNELYRFLTTQFDESKVLVAMNKYKVGTSKDGYPIFWQIDLNQGVRSGKIMKYDPNTGRRSKEVNPFWVHSKLKLEDFNLVQCFFGEHLLSDPKYNQLPIGIVESEKTAVIASIVAPEFVWLATGGKNGVGITKKNSIQALKGRNVVLFPDADAYDEWVTKSELLSPACNSVKVDNFTKVYENDTNGIKGADIADFILTANNKPPPQNYKGENKKANSLDRIQKLADNRLPPFDSFDKNRIKELIGLEYEADNIVNYLLNSNCIVKHSLIGDQYYRRDSTPF